MGRRLGGRGRLLGLAVLVALLGAMTGAPAGWTRFTGFTGPSGSKPWTFSAGREWAGLPAALAPH